FKVEARADCTESLTKELEHIKKEKEGLDSKLVGFQTVSKDLGNLLKSQRLDKNKEGLGYSNVPPPPAQLYSPPKKDLSWTGLPEFADDTVTDYSRPSPAIESTSGDVQNRNTSDTKTEASPSTISPKPFIKFMKATDSPKENKTDKGENGTSKPQNNTHKSFTPRPAIHRSYRSSMRPTRPNMNAAPRPNVNSARPQTTQDLKIILIQIVKRLERELKARTLTTKIYKVERGRSRIKKSTKDSEK
nr:hypothetical protein [Tanacetum cinerariifolium]